MSPYCYSSTYVVPGEGGGGGGRGGGPGGGRAGKMYPQQHLGTVGSLKSGGEQLAICSSTKREERKKTFKKKKNNKKTPSRIHIAATSDSAPSLAPSLACIQLPTYISSCIRTSWRHVAK